MSWVIYTLGSSNRTGEEFLRLLQCFGISQVADVRRFPTSRFEHFQRENLAELLQEAGIGYIYSGKKLGGYRQGGYRNYTTTLDFQEGLESLEEKARRKSTAILCSERFPWKCHRRFIAIGLNSRGWKVIHIIDENRTWERSESKRKSPGTNMEGAVAE